MPKMNGSWLARATRPRITPAIGWLVAIVIILVLLMLWGAGALRGLEVPSP